jgi:hypothetical protein
MSSLGGRFLSGFGACYFNSCGIPVWGIQVSSFVYAGCEGFAGPTTYFTQLAPARLESYLAR